MKTRIIMLCTAIVATGLWLSCQKMMERDSLEQDKFGDMEIGALFGSSPCYGDTVCTVTLPNDINGFTRTLHQDTVYLISGLTRVRNGGQLVIPAGTRLLGDANPMNKGFLVIEATGTIQATGSPTCPIIFTSSAPINSRNPGDWGGVFILGEADNNASGSTLALTIGDDLFNAGDVGSGVNDADNSGIFRYVQIHFAGHQPNADSAPGALLLASVGTGTEIHHIQITNPLNNGLTLFGGTAKVEYVFNYEVQNRDFNISFGNRSKMQFIASIRKDATPTTNSGYGLDISNDDLASSNTPLTHPVISNLTLLGPGYCGGDTNDYADAIRFFNNGSGSIYNSVLTGYPGYGLFLDDDDAVGNTALGANELQFSYNSFLTFGISEYGFTTSGSWSSVGGCGSGITPSMTQWITGAGTALCRETGNQIPVGSFSMHESVCEDYCTTFPTFTLGTNSLDGSNFMTWDATGFATPAYRGAFNTSGSWVDSGWMDLCPQQTAYCV